MVLVDSDRIPHVPPYSGYCYLRKLFRVRDYHTLRSAFPNLFLYNFFQISQSYNPVTAETITVWAISTSLATTTEITIVFSSYAYLDVSVQRVRVFRRYIFNVPGFPIRKYTDQKIFAPPRILSQLITSFFASESQGIPRMPLVTY